MVSPSVEKFTLRCTRWVCASLSGVESTASLPGVESTASHESAVHDGGVEESWLAASTGSHGGGFEERRRAESTGSHDEGAETRPHCATTLRCCATTLSEAGSQAPAHASMPWEESTAPHVGGIEKSRRAAATMSGEGGQTPAGASLLAVESTASLAGSIEGSRRCARTNSDEKAQVPARASQVQASGGRPRGRGCTSTGGRGGGGAAVGGGACSSVPISAMLWSGAAPEREGHAGEALSVSTRSRKAPSFHRGSYAPNALALDGR